MNNTQFILLHGYGGKHVEHWQSYLADLLRDNNTDIIYPDFPQPDNPNLEKWMSHLESVIDTSSKNGLTVAAHSLGCSLWLQFINRHPEIKVHKCFLVSPPLNNCGIEEISSFFPLPELDLSGEEYMIIGSDNDNFILEDEFKELANKLKVPLKILHNAGHINAPMHGNWEWINKESLKLI